MVLCAFRYLKLDSYHGTRYSSFQLCFLSRGSLSARSNLNLGPAPRNSCAGNSGRFSGAELFQTLAKLFPLPAISRCVPADCDRSLVQLPLPASWLEFESACPLSRPRGRHPLRCDPPTSENLSPPLFLLASESGAPLPAAPSDRPVRGLRRFEEPERFWSLDECARIS